MAKIIVESIPVGGMTCPNCERRIRKALLGIPGVVSAEVLYSQAKATVEYDSEATTPHTIRSAIEALGYIVDERPALSWKKRGDVAGIALVILAGYLLLKHTGLLRYLGVFPTAEAGMDYGMLFVIGLLTSVHCVAMCGGINLTQCIPSGANAPSAAAAVRPGLLYNAGRVVSYTVVGALVGALGSAFQISGFFRGFIQLLAGLFMVLMGLNMLGLFPALARFLPRLPAGLGERIHRRTSGKGPLVVGLLNGFMPCGPLQAMQLYALSTGHPMKGALSMLLFSLGTVPLMLGLSVFSASMSRKFARRMMTVGAVLVVILGISMFQDGMALSGMGAVSGEPVAVSREQASVTDSGVQMVTTRLSPYGYEAITVEAGIPVQWTITAESGSITGCNGRLYIPEYGIEKRLEVGDNLIEFTPTDRGVFPYSCWMGMIRSTITVTEGGEPPDAAAQTPSSPSFRMPQTPAVSYALPTQDLTVAQVEDGVQQVSIVLDENGFSHSIIVMQSGTKAQWTIENRRDGSNGSQSVVFPLYGIQLDLLPGENTVLVDPVYDFDFWLSDGTLAGYVKVVEDLDAFDSEAMLAELRGATLTYTPASVSGAGMSCCQ